MAVAVALKAHKTDVRPLSALLSGAASRSAPHLSSTITVGGLTDVPTLYSTSRRAIEYLQGMRRGADRAC